MSTVDRGTLWQWREHTWESNRCQLDGFSVEARGGSIGKIDEATDDVGASFVVVDTGPWIFGKKVMLPASIIERVDYDNETVYVSVTTLVSYLLRNPADAEETYGEDFTDEAQALERARQLADFLPAPCRGGHGDRRPHPRRRDQTGRAWASRAARRLAEDLRESSTTRTRSALRS